MGEKASFFVLRAKAVPEVLLRVVEAKRLLDSGKVESVQEATEMVQISRSSFYKYKDDIFPYHENAKGKTVNMVIQLDDEAVVHGIKNDCGISCKHSDDSSKRSG